MWIPGGRLAPVTSRLTIWFWSDCNMCQKARGNVTFASTDLSNRHVRSIIASNTLPLSRLFPFLLSV